MKKILLLFVSALMVLAGCTKDPVKPIDNADSSDFNWTTLKNEGITLAQTSDVLNQYGDTIAKNLAAGTYDLKVGSNIVLTAVPSISTKADPYASVISFPSSGNYATVMAEDLYPYKGDYDFNDLVFGLRIDYIMTQGTSKVSQINFTVIPLAVGSKYDKLGIGVYFRGEVIQFDYAAPVTGLQNDVTDIFSGLYASGLEFCDEGIVLPLTGNIRKHFVKESNKEYFPTEDTYEGYVNTSNLLNYYPGKEFTVSLKLAGNGQAYSSIELFGSNENKSLIDVFLLVNERGKEIHLKGQKATSKNTLTGNGVENYQKDGYVWMVVIDTPKQYPAELINIETAYPNFTEWAKSLGESNTDWYNYPAKPFDASLVNKKEHTDDNYLYEHLAL